jgi:hypothetical protein
MRPPVAPVLRGATLKRPGSLINLTVGMNSASLAAAKEANRRRLSMSARAIRVSATQKAQVSWAQRSNNTGHVVSLG